MLVVLLILLEGRKREIIDRGVMWCFKRVVGIL